jgi:hypothetical protein
LPYFVFYAEIPWKGIHAAAPEIQTIPEAKRRCFGLVSGSRILKEFRSTICLKPPPRLSPEMQGHTLFIAHMAPGSVSGGLYSRVARSIIMDQKQSLKEIVKMKGCAGEDGSRLPSF